MRFWQERKASRVLRPVRAGVARGFSGASRRGLEAIPLFQGLTRRDLSLLARRADPVRFREGAVVAREEDPRPQFVVIASGVAEATMGGRRVGILGPGGHFGELTLIDGAPHVPTVTALTDLEGFVLARREFWGVLHAIPALSLRLTARLAEELRRAQQLLAAGPSEPRTRTVTINPAARAMPSDAR